MEYIFGLLLSFLLLYKYAALFAIVMAAAMTLPLPANALLVAAGTFASQGYFNLWWTIAVSIAANTAGDAVIYFLARRWGHRVIPARFLKKIPFEADAEGLVRRHPGLAIFITRFLGSPAPIVNFFSGLVRVPVFKFFLYDLLGNTLALTMVIYAGFRLGIYLESLTDIAGLLDGVFLVALAIFVIYKLFFKKKA